MMKHACSCLKLLSIMVEPQSGIAAPIGIVITLYAPSVLFVQLLGRFPQTHDWMLKSWM